MIKATQAAIEAHALREITAAQAAGDRLYHEFLRRPSLSLGLYVLPVGGHDPQQPHTEDEVYYVVQGNAVLQVEGTDQPVQPGSILFVATGARHHFHSIAEELHVLVFFAPAEGSAAPVLKE